MDSIATGNCMIHFNERCYDAINTHLTKQNYSRIFVLVDVNTHAYCYPGFIANLAIQQGIEIIEIEAGEVNKTIDTCAGVWNALSELDADRKSLLINLGGGVVTDLGGFVASTFKRGITYINVPTSLLAMVDASVGGKTGVDLGHLKNQIGVINLPVMVLIDTGFLKTLPNNQMRSGLAEMLKHGLIKDEAYWNSFKDFSVLDLEDIDQLIYDSVIIKKNIVEEDPLENGLRKTLNYGHTLGHAIESYFLEKDEKTDLLHGEAIAIGMILESYISTQLLGFPEKSTNSIKSVMKSIFGDVVIHEKDFAPIISLMKYDKKNTHGNINFVLLKEIGEPVIDCQVDENIIIDAFKFYNS